MRIDTAEARGRVRIRPWRVALLIDTSSRAEVRKAIMNLSSVWGGLSMPIFDKELSIAELKELGEQYDVDSVYVDDAEGPLLDFSREAGWAWRGSGPWGPFGEAGQEVKDFWTGLLPLSEVLDPFSDLVHPIWPTEHPGDLAFAALWGLPDKLGDRFTSTALTNFLTETKETGRGLLENSMVHTDWNESKSFYEQQEVIFLLRPDDPREVTRFWNLRATGAKVIGLPTDCEPDLIAYQLDKLRVRPDNLPAKKEEHESVCLVGGQHASERVLKAITDATGVRGWEIQAFDGGASPLFYFQGLGTEFTKNIRTDFRPEAHGIDISLPQLPRRNGSSRYRRGIVAAEVELSEVANQDPRFTAQVPPYRRHASLVERRHHIHGADHVRPIQRGIAFGLDATAEDLHYPFLYSQEVLCLLFNNKAVKVTQSDVGKFQTRAAERFGGPYSGFFIQEGVRAAVTLAAGKEIGVSLDQLRNTVKNSRGNWLHPVMDRDVSPQEYAIRMVNQLFHSGLFVPTLRVHCSHCRVEGYVSVDGLGPSMNCEFCGQSFNLALSHSLAQPKWRYRLAAHLRSDQIGALLPALATTSTLQQLFRFNYSPPLVLGLEFTIEGRKVEADIATYIAEQEFMAVLGEVKTANRIDAKDIQNLEFLRSRLHEQNVRCLLVFATLKDSLSPEERRDLRALVERSIRVRASNGQSCPNLPLILTGRDLSQNTWDENHPARWDRGMSGIFGSAKISCEKNLGLVGYRSEAESGVANYVFEWSD